MYTYVDLFENYQLLPDDVQQLMLDTGLEDGMSYSELNAINDKFKALGYRFDYYRDARPYNLTKIGTAIDFIAHHFESYLGLHHKSGLAGLNEDYEALLAPDELRDWIEANYSGEADEAFCEAFIEQTSRYYDITELVKNYSVPHLHFDSMKGYLNAALFIDFENKYEEANHIIAKIQGYLGQTDVGLAGLMFDEDQWQGFNLKERKAHLQKWINMELTELIVGD